MTTKQMANGVGGVLAEQVREYFGDNYTDMFRQAKAWAGNIIRSSWLGGGVKTALNNEGGFDGMAASSLIYVIEHGDLVLGLRAYGNYLVHEYADTEEYSHRRHDNIDDPRIEDKGVHNISGQQALPSTELSAAWADRWSGATPEVEARRPSPSAFTNNRVAVTPPYPALDGLLKSEEEAEYFLTLAATNSPTETNTLLGLSKADGKRIYSRVKMRALRAEVSAR